MDHRRVGGWEAGALAAAIALGGWLVWPGVALAIGATAAALVTIILAVRSRRIGPLLAAALALIAAAGAGVSARRAARIKTDWPGVREALIQEASAQLTTTLASTVSTARELAQAGADLADSAPETAFDRLDAVARRPGPERGVVVLDSAGRPWAWAGRQRLPPSAERGELQARITPFYVVLEARRQASHRTAVGHVVLAADTAVTDAEETVAARFAREQSVRLEFLAPRAAPRASDVFDYCLPACDDPRGADTLFSVRTVPPIQQDAQADALERGGRVVGWALLLLLATVAVAGGNAARLAAAPALVLLGVLTPIADRVGLEAIFAAGTYSRPGLGPLGASVGALSLVAALVTLIVAALRGGRWPRVAGSVGVVLLLGSAPLVPWLANGIRVLPAGADTVAWLTWMIGVALTSAAVLLAAAGFLARDRERQWAAWAAGAWAGVLVVAGLATWTPAGWSAWYAWAWLPAFAGAVYAGRWRRRVIAIAVVTGCAAAVHSWDAVARQRMRLAERDAARLGPGGGDPVVGSLLDRFGAELAQGQVPHSDAELYARWLRSPLAADHYPVVLVTWGADGAIAGRLDLAELELPPALLKALAENARASGAPLVEPLTRVPGLHYVLAVPYPDGEVVTVGVGPRSRVIRAARPAELLRGAGTRAPPYEMSLSVPQTSDVPQVLRWRRDGWAALGEERLDFPDGTRHLHVQVELGSATEIAVRGVLVVLLDVLALVILWVIGSAWAGRGVVLPWSPSLLVRPSYRARLTWVLAAFFVVPTVGFALWTAGHLQNEARAARDLTIRQTLHDASRSAFGLLSEPRERADRDLDELADRFGADLNLYQGGVLTQTSADALAELGLMDFYLPPDAHRALALEDRLELATDAQLAGRPVRVGYETLAEYSDGPAVLAVARPMADPESDSTRADLAYGLLLATLVGFAASWGFAAVAARELARPVQILREAAVRVGHGEPVVPLATELPPEFGPVAEAIGQMAQAVRVLAWGELARQIAHEIKNPLTPIRLGVQHLQRAHRDPRGDFDAQLDRTAKQILAEIERLDAIARAFARFGAPAAEAGPLEEVDAAAVARDTAQLYTLGGTIRVTSDGAAPAMRARKDELREVLINLIENARDAGATDVQVAVERRRIVTRDNGRGIPPEDLPRIFEPRFSTTTSGSGLGLAICRRLVETWGGEIGVESTVGKGTVVTLRLQDGSGM